MTYFDRANNRTNDALATLIAWLSATPEVLYIRALIWLDRHGVRAFKVGGLCFVQVRRVSMSFCIRRAR